MSAILNKEQAKNHYISILSQDIMSEFQRDIAISNATGFYISKDIYISQEDEIECLNALDVK